MPLPKYFQPIVRTQQIEMISPQHTVLFSNVSPQAASPMSPGAIQHNAPLVDMPMPGPSAPPEYQNQRYPSIETLAVQLQLPNLMDLGAGGTTTEMLSTMKQQEAVDLGISKQDYFRLKEYFVQNPRG